MRSSWSGGACTNCTVILRLDFVKLISEIPRSRLWPVGYGSALQVTPHVSPLVPEPQDSEAARVPPGGKILLSVFQLFLICDTCVRWQYPVAHG